MNAKKKTVSIHITLKFQCVTEAERYSAKGYVAKPDKNKGAQKQEAWTEVLKELAAKKTFDPATRNALNKIAAQPNVPRKKDKFLNFLKSCMHIGSPNSDRVWKIIEDGLNEFKKRVAAQPPTQQNGSQANGKTTTNGEEGKAHGTNGVSANGTEVQTNTKEITVHDVISKALAKTDLDKSTKKTLKKLKKTDDLPFNVSNLKKKKFIKYLQEKLELDENSAKNVWTIVTESIAALQTTESLDKNTTATTTTTEDSSSHGNGVTNGSTTKKRKNVEIEVVASKKAKKGDDNDNEIVEVDNSIVNESVNDGETKFEWEQSILKIVNKHKQDKELTVEILKNKLLKKHASDLGTISNVEKKLLKKVKKIEKLSFENGVISLKA